MKKIIAFLCCFTMLLSLFPVLAEEPTDSNSDISNKIVEFSVPNDGEYTLKLTYNVREKINDSVEVDIKIDDTYPVSALKSVFLPVYFENDGEVRKDSEGNQFAAKVKRISGNYETKIFDSSGFINGYIPINLKKGNHTLFIKNDEPDCRILGFSFDKKEKYISYKEYINDNSDKSDYTGEKIVIEGESSNNRSKKSIVGLSDNSSPEVTPNNSVKNIVNYIGGGNWSRPGDSIEWDIDVKEEGFYNISFSYRQKYMLNEPFYRTLYIDGEVPFSEAQILEFDYNSAWSSTTFSSENSNPYKIYLTKGNHKIKLVVTMGKYAEICSNMSDIVYDLAAFYRSMVMITGENPDANRDYNLFTQIENYDGRLKSYIDSLNKILNNIVDINKSSSGTAVTNIRNMIDVLTKMRKNKYYAHEYKDRYYSNYAALSAWVYERSSMPLDINSITLSSPKEEVKNNSNFIDKTVYSVKKFFISFVEQYNHKEANDKNSVTVWINWGRDQARVLKNLVSSDFTVNTGIKVNIKITDATILQGILSGNGPDCALQVSRSEPVNLAMRGGLYDLSEFDDYEEVNKRFVKGADEPYKYKNGCYGIPNTQSFYMLFYRTDIFEQFGLSLPDTWDDFLNISNIFLRKNMQVGLPYVQITQMAQVNSGVGALNIFPTLLLQNNISIYNKEKTGCNLSSPKAIEVFVDWTNYYNKYGFPKTYDFYNRFRVGLMPMAVANYNMYATLNAAAPEISKYWKMATIPGVKNSDGTINRSVAAGGTAAVILKDANNYESAWEFIKWWTSTDIQYEYASEIENILGTAARYETANVEALKKLDWDKENLNALLEQWKNVKEIEEIPGSYYLARVIDQAFWTTTNGEDPYETIDKWSEIANNEIVRKEKQYE